MSITALFLQSAERYVKVFQTRGNKLSYKYWIGIAAGFACFYSLFFALPFIFEFHHCFYVPEPHKLVW